MLLKCLLIFGLIFSLEGASISKGIPVSVVYLETTEIPGNAGDKVNVRYLQNRNLDEKVQLSSRELKEANQHIPLPEQDGKLFSKAKTVFLEKLSNFRKQVDGFPLKTNQKKPTSEDWSRLNEKLQVVFKKYEVSGLRQGGLLSELTQATTQWFQGLAGNTNRPEGEDDEKPENQGGLGQAWANFQNGISEAFSNLTNNNNNNNNPEGTTSNTVLGDTGVSPSTSAPGFFQNIISTVLNGNNQGNKPGQEDTGVTSPPNIFQGAISNIINTFSPSSEKPGISQGDTVESSTSGPTNQFFQNIGEAFGQVFGGQSTKPPGTNGDNESPTSFFGNVGNVIQSVFNQNQGSSTVGTPLSEGSTSSSGPTIFNQGLQQIQIPGQNAGQQIVQGFQNPQNFAQNIGQQISEASQNNTFQSFGQQITEGLQNPQNIAHQSQNIGQQISENLPSGSQSNNGQGLGQQISEAFQNQNFASQAQNIGQQISGNLPSGSQSNNGQGLGQQITEGLQNPQNIASQSQNIGQQISENLPSGSQSNNGQGLGQQISEAFQNQNFVSQAQNIGQQISGNLPSGSQSNNGQGLGQQITEGLQNPQNIASQSQNIGQQISENLPSGSQSNNGQGLGLGQQISEAFQNQNFVSQAQNFGQQISGNKPTDSEGNTGQAIGQQIVGAFQNPQNIASQAQNIGQQLSENIPSPGQNSQSSVSNLDVNQIPFIGPVIGMMGN